MGGPRRTSTGWLWDPYPVRSVPTIAVSEPSKKQQEAREKKVEEGAKVVPFGFSRVLHEGDERE